jgi:hypothetical protein
MRRTPLTIILLTGLLLVLAACGGSPSESPDASSNDQPDASQDGGGGGDGGGDDGGGGGGIGVTLSDGTWTGGEAEVAVSGGADTSFSSPLYSPTSVTAGSSTSLTYINETGGAIAVAIYPDSFAVSVTTADLVGGGGTTTTCTVNWRSTDDNNVSADFSCPNSPAFTTAGGAADSVNIEGSFTATR